MTPVLPRRIIVIDDELATRMSVKAILSPPHDVTMISSATEGLARIASDRPDLLILDLAMPEMSGLEVLRRLRDRGDETPVIVVSGSSESHAADALALGATQCLIKPFDVSVLRAAAAEVFAQDAMRHRLSALQDDMSRIYPTDGLVGHSAAFRHAVELIDKAADTDASVVIIGESGTGKEIMARRLHAHSSRGDQPFVAVHCAAVPETLIESELFGHEKGAFTGATSARPGRFAMAGRGTLFFDELGDIPLSAQVKLLRAIQEREVTPVGGTRRVPVQARFVAATHRELEGEVAAGRFREDLYYRLAVVTVRIPPLRERREDIPELSRYFIDDLRRSMTVKTTGISGPASDALCAYDWPGNVRELRNVIEGILVVHGEVETIDLAQLPDRVLPAPARRSPAGTYRQPMQEVVDDFTRQMILDALERTGGNQTHAAAILGTTRRILGYKMAKLGIASTDPSDN